jgi:hypothetical protein
MTGWFHIWKECSCAWSYHQAGYCQTPGRGFTDYVLGPHLLLFLLCVLCIFSARLSVYRTFCSGDTCYATFVAPGFTSKSDTYTIHQRIHSMLLA